LNGVSDLLDHMRGGLIGIIGLQGVGKSTALIARMSWGIFRRFLRYITLTLDMHETQAEPRKLIDSETVRKTISTERLAEDTDLELAELFPKHSDLRLQAVRLLMHLQEYGPTKQSELGEELDMGR